jgi:RES domain-containing protein
LAIADFIQPWIGDVYRHIPNGSPFPVTDFRFAGRSPDNRWNDVGEPTLYLASDPGLAIAEFARHLARDYAPNLLHQPLQRHLYRLRVHVEGVLDLCAPGAWLSLGDLDDAPNCFLSRDIARATARFVRATTSAQAIRVPSVAFLDDLDRWSLVVFLDKLTDKNDPFILEVEDAGVVAVTPATS